jgi:hypothetical protein
MGQIKKPDRMIGRRTRFSSRRLELFFNPDYAALVIDEVLSVGVAVLHIALVDSIYGLRDIVSSCFSVLGLRT